MHTLIESVDVNVTPDKRQVMVQEEKALLFFVKVWCYYDSLWVDWLLGVFIRNV